MNHSPESRTGAQLLWALTHRQDHKGAAARGLVGITTVGGWVGRRKGKIEATLRNSCITE